MVVAVRQAVAVAQIVVVEPLHIVLLSAHISAELEAGVGSRNVEEARSEGIADPHVFDRLDGRKVGGLRPGAGGQDCRGAEE